MKQIWPAAERNKQPILEVLRGVLSAVFPTGGTLLEVASGTGQHAAFFASQLPSWTWQPSDLDEKNLASIRAFCSEAALPNLRAPLRLDVCEPNWPLPPGSLQAVFNANMIHIAPWACCLGLMAGAARLLGPGGVLVMYGPFSIDGVHTAPSNAEFDQSLKARDARWGVRDLGAVQAVAQAAGLLLEQRVAMPANNQLLVFRRAQTAPFGPDFIGATCATVSSSNDD